MICFPIKWLFGSNTHIYKAAGHSTVSVNEARESGSDVVVELVLMCVHLRTFSYMLTRAGANRESGHSCLHWIKAVKILVTTVCIML